MELKILVNYKHMSTSDNPFPLKKSLSNKISTLFISMFELKFDGCLI